MADDIDSARPSQAAPAVAFDACRGEETGWERLTFVFGGPRSGTSWLAKIFDSHPAVLYRHEPDTVLRNPTLPFYPTPEDVVRHREAARDWVERLLDIRTLKSAGSLPVFHKSYLSGPAWLARQGSIFALRAMDGLPGRARRLTRRLPLPDFVDWRHRPDVRLVMKSVSARGRVALLAQAVPGSSVVFILRHPCGNIASEMRGEARGLFEQAWEPAEVLQNPLAARYGLTRERLFALPRVEQRAWNWVVSNQAALEALSSLQRVRVIRYQDLCARPMQLARELFAFARRARLEPPDRGLHRQQHHPYRRNPLLQRVPQHDRGSESLAD